MASTKKILCSLSIFLSINHATGGGVYNHYGVKSHPGFPETDYLTTSLIKPSSLHLISSYPKEVQNDETNYETATYIKPDLPAPILPYYPVEEIEDPSYESKYQPKSLIKPAMPYYSQEVPKYETPGVYHDHSSSDKMTVHKHVYVHVAPDDEPITETRIIRPDIPKNKHVNIIFIKAPTQPQSQSTEVHLPEEPKHKTLIYILVKKPRDIAERIKVKGPEPTLPPKPEVFFIRYKNQASSYGNPSYDAYPPPSSSVELPETASGPGSDNSGYY